MPVQKYSASPVNFNFFVPYVPDVVVERGVGSNGVVGWSGSEPTAVVWLQRGFNIFNRFQHRALVPSVCDARPQQHEANAGCYHSWFYLACRPVRMSATWLRTMRRGTMELTTLGLWDLRVANCAIAPSQLRFWQQCKILGIETAHQFRKGFGATSASAKASTTQW